MNKVTVDFLKDGIVDAILNFDGPITCVEAGTGSGKSTIMPKTLVEKGSATMFICEPVVTACYSLQSYMKKILPNVSIGVAAEGNVAYENSKLKSLGRRGTSDVKDTQLVYCTSGHLSNIFTSLAKYGTMNGGFNNLDLSFCDIIMIDEMHTGILDNDIILHLYKYMYDRGAILPRLILSSATINMESTVFSNNKDLFQIFTVDVNVYPVDEIYHDKTLSPSSSELIFETADVIKKLHKKIPVAPEGDSWLVFCPGSKEIEDILANLSHSKLLNIEILPAYSSLGYSEIQKIHNPFTPEKRRIILATNIAEMAITIVNLSGVIDTLTEKYAETSSMGGLKLVTHYASLSSAQQRKGRTGRTCTGFCYRMMKEDDFKSGNLLLRFRPNEIDRVPLHNSLISLMDAKINPYELFEERVNVKKIQNSVSILKDLRMIEVSPFKVTSLGRFASSFPLSVRGSALLYSWLDLKASNGRPLPIFPGLSLIILLETYAPNFLFIPRDSSEERQKYITKYFDDYRHYNDVEIMLHVWNKLIGTLKRTQGVGFKEELKKYNIDNSLNNKIINDAINRINTCINILKSKNYQVNIGTYNVQNVIDYMTPLLIKVFHNFLFKRVSDYSHENAYINEETNKYWKMNQTNMLKIRVGYFPANCIGINIFETASNSTIEPRRFISLWLPYEKTLEKIVTVDDLYNLPELDDLHNDFPSVPEPFLPGINTKMINFIDPSISSVECDKIPLPPLDFLIEMEPNHEDILDISSKNPDEEDDINLKEDYEELKEQMSYDSKDEFDDLEIEFV